MRRRFTLVVAIVAVASIVVVAGYLGLRGARAPDSATQEEPVTVAVARGDVELTIIAPGTVLGTEHGVLVSRVGGEVATVGVRPGDVVSAGDVLVQLGTERLRGALETARDVLGRARGEHGLRQAEAELDSRIAEARLRQAEALAPSSAAAEAAVAVAESELQLVRQGASELELIAAAAERENAEVSLRVAQAAYDQVKHRADIGALPQSIELQRATNAHVAAKARHDALVRGPEPAAIAVAEARLRHAQALLDQARAEQAAGAASLAIARAEVERARLALERTEMGVDAALVRAVDQAEADLAAATITARYDGVVLEVLVRPGESVTAGSPVATTTDPGALEIVATIIEEDLPLLAIGQTVDIFFDAAPDVEAVTGTVARIVPQRTNDVRPLYPVHIAVNEFPPGIASGMTADGSIIIERRSEVLRLPRALVRARSDGLAQVEVWAGGQAESRTVQVGLRGDVYVEVLSGLVEGEEVVAE